MGDKYVEERIQLCLQYGISDTFIACCIRTEYAET
jgi:hypothetical protein